MRQSVLVFLPIALTIVLGSFSWDDFGEKEIIANSTASIVQDSSFDEEKALAYLREKIKGREKEPAEDVFENIKIMKGFRAGRLLVIMKRGFANSLGVSCDHCHVTDDWASEEKDEKQIARDMWQMVGTINKELLAKIPNLESENPGINCTTCHRGKVKPAKSMKKK